MVPGVAIQVGEDGGYLLVPALTWQEKKENHERLLAIMQTSWATMDDETMGWFVAIAHKAVSRNHPALSLERFEQLLDLRAAVLILMALCGTGKYEAPPPESTGGWIDINPLSSLPPQSV